MITELGKLHFLISIMGQLISYINPQICSVSTMFLLISLCRKAVLSISRRSSCMSLLSQDCMGFTATNGRPTECSSSAQSHVIGGIVCARVRSVYAAKNKAKEWIECDTALCLQLGRNCFTAQHDICKTKTELNRRSLFDAFCIYVWKYCFEKCAPSHDARYVASSHSIPFCFLLVFSEKTLLQSFILYICFTCI